MQEEKIESSKKAALIVAFRDFRDEEYFAPKEILERAGVKVLTVSDELGVAIGADERETKVDISLKDLKVEDFDVILFIGGPGALSHLDNERSYEIARTAEQKEKILGSICISGTILAKAGVLQGKRATVWSSQLDRSPIKILQESGAVFEDKKVVVDGKIVTANGPTAAKEFGEKLKELLK